MVPGLSSRSLCPVVVKVNRQIAGVVQIRVAQRLGWPESSVGNGRRDGAQTRQVQGNIFARLRRIKLVSNQLVGGGMQSGGVADSVLILRECSRRRIGSVHLHHIRRTLAPLLVT